MSKSKCIMQIHEQALTSELKQIIYNGFKEHDISLYGTVGITESISFCIKDIHDNVIAAVVVHMLWGALHIKYVWTHKNHRNKGCATTLMHRVFEYAKEKECPFAFIETMSFQAPEFYKKFGFVLELERKGYAHNTSFCYLRKDFNVQAKNG